MFTEILIPEVMASMVPEGFPVDKLSQPKYKVKVEKDVFVEMRDGVHVAVDIYRPDAAGAVPRALRLLALSEGPLLPAGRARPSTCARPTRSSGSSSAATSTSTTTSAAAASRWRASGAGTAWRSS